MIFQGTLPIFNVGSLSKLPVEYITSAYGEGILVRDNEQKISLEDEEKLIEEGKEIEATGHQKTEVRGAKEATCEKAGYTGDTYCLKCEKKISTGTEIAKKPHTWNAGKVTTAPQCEKEGVKTYICTKCGATKTEAVEATGHQHTEIRNAKEAECETTGYTGDTYCTDCNKKLKLPTLKMGSVP